MASKTDSQSPTQGTHMPTGDHTSDHCMQMGHKMDMSKMTPEEMRKMMGKG